MVLDERRSSSLALTRSAIQALINTLDGEVILPEDSRYDDERRVFNAAIDQRPAMIARIAGPRDASRVIAFAKLFEVPVTVRSGGHSTPGFCVRDGAIMIDTSLLKGVEVDVERRVARAGAGLRAGEYVPATEQYGLVSPVGDSNHTGLAGLTLGGGYGYLSGKYGLVIDNLLAAEVVTADGRILRASEQEHEDLFWALRGGSGNFGVVTAFEFRLHPLTQVLGGMMIFPFPLAREVLTTYRAMTQHAPDELTMYAGLATPPGQQPIAAVIVSYAGDVADGERAIAALRALGPVVDTVGPMPYSAMGQIVAPFAPEGMQRDDRWINIRELSDESIDTLIALAEPSRSLGNAIVIKQINGVAARVSPGATAFPHRHLPYSVVALAQWMDPAMAPAMRGWVSEVVEAFKPVTGGVYVNGADDEAVASIYGSNYQRLVGVKNRYDPTNFFAGNINVEPTV